MKLIIFDIDGTLVDSQAFILEAQRRAFSAHALETPDRQASLSIVGLSLHEAFSVLAGPDGPIDGLSEAYRAAWSEIRADPTYEEQLYPGAREAVATLAARRAVTLGVATGKSRRGVDHLFAQTGWADAFRTVQTSDDHPSKPAPNMIRAALMETGADPAATLMIGDTSFDMAMARAAGVRPIGVAWGYHDRAALEAAGAEHIVADFAELLHFIGP